MSVQSGYFDIRTENNVENPMDPMVPRQSDILIAARKTGRVMVEDAELARARRLLSDAGESARLSEV